MWTKTGPTRRKRSLNVFTAIVMLLAAVNVVSLTGDQARGYSKLVGTYSAPSIGPGFAADTSTGTYPHGIQVTATASGNSMITSTAVTMSTRGYDNTQFTPEIGGTSARVDLMVTTSDQLGGTVCPDQGLCTGRGSISFAFSQPVKNPIMHVSGIGGFSQRALNGAITGQSQITSIWNLTTPSTTLTKLDGNAQLAVNGGTQITAANANASPSCISTVGRTPFGGPGGVRVHRCVQVAA